ncbi:PQQ-dependent sugar dehydrogenase [Gelatiniphilus marinus]|uniref:PQQ-dependent sugar dehydrogenase n=1 Tax=Gelatiniphilus marinus TaxID=1759464 RepID=A0ABW5JLV9_9FLAO
MKTLVSILIFNSFIFLGFSQTVELQNFGPNFSNPVEIANANDSRLFIVEQAGIIKILTPSGTVNPTPFLNITTKVGSGGERGLLGLAFAPDYKTSGRFYVNYTDNTSTTEPNTIIARYTVSTNPDIANTTETVLLTIKQPFDNHNGGKLAFGPDGFLYIATGDGGAGGDPGDRSQNTSSLLGKLLRIDVSGSSYNIPSSNPFSSSANGQNDPRPEIYAIGLRNPWKFSFDKLNGDLWIADVGQNDFEEINKVTGSGTPGDNYGWRCYEGNNHVFNDTGNCPASFNETIAPVAEYAHVGNGCSGSITGGYVYRGTMFTNFIGKYFFADFCTQQIGILTDAGSGWSMAMQTPNIARRWTTFGEDNNGELYIVGGSNIFKITDPNLSVDESKLFNFKLHPNPSNNNVSIDLSSKFKTVESISIYNIHGQKIESISKSNKQILNISVKNYHSGLYFVEVCTNNASKIVKKLIIN